MTKTRTTERAIEELLEYRCAALIVIGPELSDPALQALAQRARVPLVSVGYGELNEVYDVVRSAGDEGIEAIVRHIVILGHRRPAYVNWRCHAAPPACGSPATGGRWGTLVSSPMSSTSRARTTPRRPARKRDGCCYGGGRCHGRRRLQ